MRGSNGSFRQSVVSPGSGGDGVAVGDWKGAARRVESALGVAVSEGKVMVRKGPAPRGSLGGER